MIPFISTLVRFKPFTLKGGTAMRATAFVVVLSIVLLSTAAFADVPSLISYQGTLTDENGVALDTTVSMTFSIYTDSTGGIQVWTEDQSAVQVNNGLFNVLLGSQDAIEDTVFKGVSRWLGVKVGDDPDEMQPRQRIAAVGYSFKAAEADTADYARSAPAGADSVLYADSSGYADSAGYAPMPDSVVHAVYADTADYAVLADSAASAAYADVAAQADTADWALGAPPDGDWTISGNDMYSAVSGNVGIGTTSPAYDLDVVDDAKVQDNLYVGRDLNVDDDVTVQDDLTVDGKLILNFELGSGNYTSHWFSMSPGEVTLTHGLGGTADKYIVYMDGKNSYGIHHANYGTIAVRKVLATIREFGCCWRELNSSTITVCRMADDDTDILIHPRNQWDQVRVRILKNQ